MHIKHCNACGAILVFKWFVVKPLNVSIKTGVYFQSILNSFYGHWTVKYEEEFNAKRYGGEQTRSGHKQMDGCSGI